jgi:alpha-tubulin suppressor-like RCC1 family protein/plastocyanin
MKRNMGMRFPHLVGFIMVIAVLVTSLDTPSPVANGAPIQVGPAQALNPVLSGTAVMERTPVAPEGLIPVPALPAQVRARANVSWIDVKLGSNYGCGIVSSGDAYCWGTNVYGQLGNGNTQPSSTPVAVAGGLSFKSIHLGESQSLFSPNTCGITISDLAYCWGDNTYGQLTEGTTSLRSSPVAVAGSITFSKLAIYNGTICGVSKAGGAYCWGSADGRVGDYSGLARRTPFQVLPALSFSQVQPAYDHVCGLTTGGDVWCWGSGTGSSPIRVNSTETFTKLTAGGSTTCGLTTAGRIYCWGLTWYVVPTPTGATYSGGFTPVLVGSGQTFNDALFGWYFHCALTTTQAAYCWGAGESGQLGVGSVVTYAYAPSAVSGGLTFNSLALGNGFGCGVSDAGNGYCWGANSLGQVGDGTSVTRLAPVPLLPGVPLASITVNYQSACARTIAGSLYCWGDNTYGQLGNGTTSSTSATGPIRVTDAMIPTPVPSSTPSITPSATFTVSQTPTFTSSPSASASSSPTSSPTPTSSNTASITPSSTPSPTAVPASTSTQAASSTQSRGPVIAIANFAFVPSIVTIYRGEIVRWTNTSATTTHSVRAADGTWDSGPIYPGGSFSLDFGIAGTYQYVSSGGAGMAGSVIVLEATVTPMPTATASLTPSRTASATALGTPSATNTPSPTSSPTASRTSTATETPTASRTSTLTSTPTATATPVTGVRTRNLRVTNVSEGGFTVVWTTSIPTTGSIRVGPATGVPTEPMSDVRGAMHVSTVHVVEVAGLASGTRYLFDVISGDGTDTNVSAHYPVTTASNLPVPVPDTAFGHVLASSGAPAPDAIVVVTVEAPDGGSTAVSTLLTAADAGTWVVNLSDLRTPLRTASYPLATGTVLTIEAIGGTAGYARATVTVEEARTGAGSVQLAPSLRADLSLQTGWNLIALSLEPVEPVTAASLCATVAGLTEIDRWNGGWDAHLCALPANDFPIEMGRGYFLRLSASRVWTYDGLPWGARLPFTLQSGWNLIGLPGAATRLTAPGIVNSIAIAGGATVSTATDVIREVDRWHDGRWQGHLAGLPPDPFAIEEGRGYFVRLLKPVTWNLPANTGTNRVRTLTIPLSEPPTRPSSEGTDR